MGHLGLLLGIPTIGIPTSIYDDFSQDSGKWLDGNLASAAMTVANGRGIWSPTLGSEVLTNGNMETGSPPSGWTQYGSATLASVADERTGGAGAASLSIKSAASSFGGVFQDQVTTGWFQTTGWLRKVTNANPRPSISRSAFNEIFRGPLITSTSWTSYVMTAFVISGSLRLSLGLSTNVLNDEARADDQSVKPVTHATMFRLRRVYYVSTIAAAIRRTAYTQKGVVLFKDANNYVLAYMRANSGDTSEEAVLVKRVAGVPSAVIANANITYAAGGVLQLTPNAAFTTFGVSYGGAQVIAPQAIADFTFSSGSWYGGLFNAYSDGGTNDGFGNFLAQRVAI